MKYMTINELRKSFLDFFKEKEHLILQSYSLVPESDKTLLLINAGMAPMKSYFTGAETPPSKRVATSQKCMRTGDIENVGITSRHNTFFEMLGNFSFGDYFKEEAIEWAWEYLTEVLNIPEDRLYVSIYEEDDEAFDIWNKKMNLSEEKIFRFGKEDNFWELGTGPSGPCSEIFYDRGEKYGCGDENCTVGCECDRFMELWNLVFTQFDKQEDGEYILLDHPNIDTGMGLERLGVAMQDVETNMDIDTMKAIRNKVCEIAKVEYGVDEKKDISIRIITDHVRAVTFMLSDGVLPNNEGRGYVLRRLLRRAARHGKLLGIDHLFLQDVCKVVIKENEDAYPELKEKEEYILKILSVEENRFYETLDQGLEVLKGYISRIKKAKESLLIGEDAFRMYDTFGFPLELMKEILEEESIDIDEDGFKEEMEKQRELSRSSRDENAYTGGEESVYAGIDHDLHTLFTGYDELTTKAKLMAIVVEDNLVEKAVSGTEVSLVLDRTPFYALGGGQEGDEGIIETKTGKVEIIDTIKIIGDKFAHIGKVIDGYIEVGSDVLAKVDKRKRMNTARNHTATHLLFKALREVLGNHVEQAGSSVDYNRLRFDFTHFEAVTDEEIKQIEEMVNDFVLDSLNVEIINTDINTAKEMGATALFGEKYGEEVRVIKIEDCSMELCGGTHLKNTSQVSTFKILSEGGISAGVRRIEAITGEAAIKYYNRKDELLLRIGNVIKANEDNIINRIENNIDEVKELKQEIERLKREGTVDILSDILDEKMELFGKNVVIANAGDMDMNSLRELGDRVRDNINKGVIILASKDKDKANLIVMVTNELVDEGINANNIIKEIAPIIDGRGGGRPNMAQAGGESPDKIDQLVEKAKTILEEIIK